MKCQLLFLACLVFLFSTGCKVTPEQAGSKFQASCIKSEQFGAARLDFPVGRRKGFVLLPTKARADGTKLWVWLAPTFIHHPNPRIAGPRDDHEWMCKQFLANGIYVCGVDVGESYGNVRGRRFYSRFYKLVVKEFGLSEKPCMLGVSRGGLMVFNWAAENPRRVQCIGGIYPLVNLEDYLEKPWMAKAYGRNIEQFKLSFHEHNPIDRLWRLAKADVPILHLNGDVDKAVVLEKNSGELVRRYKIFGGRAAVIIIKGKSHEICPEFFRDQQLVDFLISGGRDMPSTAK